MTEKDDQIAGLQAQVTEKDDQIARLRQEKAELMAAQAQQNPAPVPTEERREDTASTMISSETAQKQSLLGSAWEALKEFCYNWTVGWFKQD